MPDATQAAMFDPMAKWTPPPDWMMARIIRADWSATPVFGLGLTIIGGNLTAATAALAPDACELGLWHIAPAGPLLLRIGRDKALLVTDDATDVSAGWRSDGWYATPATGAYAVIDIDGDALDAMIREATATNVGAGSPSTATLFAGVTALLIRMRYNAARLFVEVGHAPYVWRWLETRSG
jgi:hypothetical protein